jgi:hypothetical protein
MPTVGRFAHVTLGKAGSQWIKDVLTDPDILGRLPGLRFVQPTGTYRIADFAREPDGTFVAPIFQVTYDDWKAYALPGDRCIAVLRDPRDSIVSWAFSVAYSHATEDHIRLVRPAMLALDLRGKLEISMYTFWESSAAQRSWARCQETESEQLYTYERVISDPLAAFTSMLDFLGFDAPGAVLATVVDRLSFKARSAREPGQKDDFSHYRNGVAGDWRNYFDRSLAERFERVCPGLLCALGYEPGVDWWESVPETCALLEADAASNSSAAESLALRAALDVARRREDALSDAYEGLLARVRALRGIEKDGDIADIEYAVKHDVEEPACGEESATVVDVA